MTAHAVAIDLARPDAFIQTQSLARLPRDILKIPLLKDVLTEDFVYYYEQNESRLSVAGSIRRIAFEHDLTISDDILNAVLNEPADVALWRDGTGKLRYWLISLQRNRMAKLLQALANVAASDAQLRQVSEITVEGTAVPLYAFDYGYQKTLLFATMGERMVVLSDPGMLLEILEAPAVDQNASEKKAPEPTLVKARATIVAGLLGKNAASNTIYQNYFGLPTRQAVHQVALSADFLSFGYQQFFAGVQALRFDFSGQTWTSALLADAQHLPKTGWHSAEVWHAMPASPAACASLPVGWGDASPMLASLTEDPNAAAALSTLKGPVAVCWYGKSKLASPVFVAQFPTAAVAKQHAPALSKMFDELIGAHESVRGARFPVAVSHNGAATLWQRPVSARYGAKLVGADARAAQFSAARYFPVTMAVSGPYVAFSPDGRLVEEVVSVLAHQYPSAADGVANSDSIVLQFAPASLSPLLQHEAFDALPEAQETIFRDAATRHLAPKLKALAKYPSFSASLAGALPRQGVAWVPVTWQFKAK